MANTIQYLHAACIFALPLLPLAVQMYIASLLACFICIALFSDHPFYGSPDRLAILKDALRGTCRYIKNSILIGLLVLCMIVFGSASFQLFRLMIGIVLGL